MPANRPGHGWSIVCRARNRQHDAGYDRPACASVRRRRGATLQGVIAAILNPLSRFRRTQSPTSTPTSGSFMSRFRISEFLGVLRDLRALWGPSALSESGGSPLSRSPSTISVGVPRSRTAPFQPQTAKKGWPRSTNPSIFQSGRPGLNRRPSRWQRDVLPLNYSRIASREQQLKRIPQDRFVINETLSNA